MRVFLDASIQNSSATCPKQGAKYDVILPGSDRSITIGHYQAVTGWPTSVPPAIEGRQYHCGCDGLSGAIKRVNHQMGKRKQCVCLHGMQRSRIPIYTCIQFQEPDTGCRVRRPSGCSIVDRPGTCRLLMTIRMPCPRVDIPRESPTWQRRRLQT